MHRIDGPGATFDNKFTEGDPIGGVQATVVTDDWLNAVQEEIMSVLADRSIAPVKGQQDQLLTAIKEITQALPIPTPQGSYKDLVVSTTGVDAFITVFIGRNVLEDAAGKTIKARNFFGRLNTATTGLNGIDAGVVAASSWYSIWEISDGTNFGLVAALIPTLNCNTTNGSAVVTGLASTALMRPGMPVSGGNVYTGTVVKSVDSPTQVTLSKAALVTGATSLKFQYDPVMPYGYTYKARISSLPTDATANKFPLGIDQENDVVTLQLGLGNVTSTPVIANGALGNIAGTPAGWIAASVVSLVPPTACEIHGFAGNSVGSGTLIVAGSSLFGGVASVVSVPFTISGGAVAPTSTPFRLGLERFAVMYASNVSSATCNQLGWKDRL